MNILLFTLSIITVSAQHSPAREYQVKAVFIYNFTQFVEWPINTFPSDQTPMVIGVLGDDPFGNYLEEAIADEKTGSHPLLIQHYKTPEEVKGCHLLFVNLPFSKKLPQIIEDFKKHRILTIGDDTDFIKQGGMIAFANRNGKIKIQINPEAVKDAGLEISSKLLRLAEIIIPEKK